jgi:hypothetical protein
MKFAIQKFFSQTTAWLAQLPAPQRKCITGLAIYTVLRILWGPGPKHEEEYAFFYLHEVILYVVSIYMALKHPCIILNAIAIATAFFLTWVGLVFRIAIRYDYSFFEMLPAFQIGLQRAVILLGVSLAMNVLILFLKQWTSRDRQEADDATNKLRKMFPHDGDY